MFGAFSRASVRVMMHTDAVPQFLSNGRLNYGIGKDLKKQGFVFSQEIIRACASLPQFLSYYFSVNYLYSFGVGDWRCRNKHTPNSHAPRKHYKKAMEFSLNPQTPAMSCACHNPSLQITNRQTIEMKNNEIKKPGPYDVLIHPRCTGICGTDLHFWRHGEIGNMKFSDNGVIGHESSGDVLQVGSKVKGIKVGDRVAIEPQMPCLECFLCKNGNYNLCDNVRFIGIYPDPGTMQRFIVHDYRFVHKMPDNMTYSQGALVEPVSVAYHGIERSDIELGKGALICGAGPIGLSTLVLAKARGATPLVITDLDAKKLAFAQKLVPEVKTFCISTKLSPQETAAEIRGIFGPTEYDAPVSVLECTGVGVSIITGAFVVRRNGTLLVIGVGKPTVDNFPFMHLSLAEIDVKFINRYKDSWPAVMNLISNKVIDVDAMVTHTFKLEDADRALRTCGDPEVFSVKVQVEDNVEAELPDFNIS